MTLFLRPMKFVAVLGVLFVLKAFFLLPFFKGFGRRQDFGGHTFSPPRVTGRRMKATRSQPR